MDPLEPAIVGCRDRSCQRAALYAALVVVRHEGSLAMGVEFVYLLQEVSASQRTRKPRPLRATASRI